MPEKLPEQLGPERMRDLLTFLLTPPPQMPRDHPGPRPKPRTLAEVNAVLAGAPNPPEKTRPIHILLVAGPKDHGIGEHDYPALQKAWPNLLAAADERGGVNGLGVAERRAVQTGRRRRVLPARRLERPAGDRYRCVLERGGGLVYHPLGRRCGQKGGHEFAKRIGLAGPGLVGFRHGDVDARVQPRQPSIRSSATSTQLKLFDETYWKMAGSLPADRVLATAVEDGQPQPQMWTLEPGNGRVFVSIPGHFSWTFDDPLFRICCCAASRGRPTSRSIDSTTSSGSVPIDDRS